MGENATFVDCVQICASDARFVANVERLTGHTFAFAQRRAPIDIAIDQQTGRDDADMALFVAIVDEIVWSRIPGVSGVHIDAMARGA